MKTLPWLSTAGYHSLLELIFPPLLVLFFPFLFTIQRSNLGVLYIRAKYCTTELQPQLSLFILASILPFCLPKGKPSYPALHGKCPFLVSVQVLTPGEGQWLQGHSRKHKDKTKQKTAFQSFHGHVHIDYRIVV